MPHLNSVSVDVFVKMGSMYEKDVEGGMAHFLEHMAFKGTNKRTSSYEINKEIDSRGGEAGASTSFELTNYRIRTVSANLKWAIELLADMVINSTVPDKEVTKERGVVIEEIKMYDDNPTMGASFDFVELMYGVSKRGCWSISGKEKDVNTFNHKDLVSYRKRYLKSENVIVVLTGNLKSEKSDIDDMMQFVGKSFEGLKKGLDYKYVWGKDYIIGNKTYKRIDKKLKQAHVCIGFPTIGRVDDRKYALKLIDIILAGNMSSRLFSKLREELGWAYYLFSESHLFSDFGYCGVQAGVTRDKVDEVTEIIINEFCDLYDSVTDKEIDEAKNYWLARSKLNLDSLKFWSSFIGRSYLLDNRLVNFKNEVDKMKKVSSEEIRKVAKEYFDVKMRRILTIS